MIQHVKYILFTRSKGINVKSPITTLDLKNISHLHPAQTNFEPATIFLKYFVQSGHLLKLKNFKLDLIDGILAERRTQNLNDLLNYLNQAITTINSYLAVPLSVLNCSNLERLAVIVGFDIYPIGIEECFLKWHDLPSLKRLDITIEGDCSPKLFQRWLSSMKRLTVTSLSLVYDCGRREDRFIRFAKVLRPKVLVENFPNLEYLEISKWAIVNSGFLRLWSGLPRLEELIIDNCPNFGNTAMIGENPQQPAFLCLKKLRKLSLTLDKMPYLTDRAFTDVIRHMSLKELHLSCKFPLEKITIVGIKSLLTGPFAQSIERFPFKGWCLDSNTEFKDLSKKFRSIL